jgi:hypothetical protein
MRPRLDFDPSDEERASSLLTRDDPAQRSTSMMTDDVEHRRRDYDSAVADLGRDFTSGTAAANGTTIHYVRGGGGPALVFLHGFPQDWFEWRRLMPRLAESFSVIAIDLRGVGGSAAPSDGYAAADRPGAEPREPRGYGGSRSGARGTRTPDLLGAIQADARVDFGLFAGCMCPPGARISGRNVPQFPTVLARTGPRTAVFGPILQGPEIWRDSRELRRTRAYADAPTRGLANLGGRGDQRRCRRGHRVRSGPSGCAEATCSSFLTAATPAQGHARSGAARQPGRARGPARTRRTRGDARPRSRSCNRSGHPPAAPPTHGPKSGGSRCSASAPAGSRQSRPASYPMALPLCGPVRRTPAVAPAETAILVRAQSSRTTSR